MDSIRMGRQRGRMGVQAATGSFVNLLVKGAVGPEDHHPIILNAAVRG